MNALKLWANMNKIKLTKRNEESSMNRKSQMDLAHLIVMIDLFRDELYEQLLKKEGIRAVEILREVQNDYF